MKETGKKYTNGEMLAAVVVAFDKSEHDKASKEKARKDLQKKYRHLLSFEESQKEEIERILEKQEEMFSLQNLPKARQTANLEDAKHSYNRILAGALKDPYKKLYYEWRVSNPEESKFVDAMETEAVAEQKKLPSLGESIDARIEAGKAIGISESHTDLIRSPYQIHTIADAKKLLKVGEDSTIASTLVTVCLGLQLYCEVDNIKRFLGESPLIEESLSSMEVSLESEQIEPTETQVKPKNLLLAFALS